MDASSNRALSAPVPELSSRSDSWRINEPIENASDMLRKVLEQASRYGSTSDFWAGSTSCRNTLAQHVGVLSLRQPRCNPVRWFVAANGYVANGSKLAGPRSWSPNRHHRCEHHSATATDTFKLLDFIIFISFLIPFSRPFYAILFPALIARKA